MRSGWLASLWNRAPSAALTPGALGHGHGAYGTALLGPSPDGSGFAVFAVVTGDGAVVQAHVQDGIDGLAPAGTITVGSDDPGLIGIALNWAPRPVLFIADARRDRIVRAHLAHDTRHFTLERLSHIGSPWLRQPVDLAAAIPEIANPRFASHTTLASGADLYVANRGDGSLLRIDQAGTVLARARVEIPGEGPVGANRLRALAVSADAQRLWLIVQRAGAADSVLLELSGFDAGGVFAAPPQHGSAATASAAPARPATRAALDQAARGARIFSTSFTPETGLGAQFNAASCLVCHPGPGGSSAAEVHFARRVAHMDPASGRIVAIATPGGTRAMRFSGVPRAPADAPLAALPRTANVVSLRMPSALFGVGQMDDIADAVIEAQAVNKGDGIKGRVNRVTAADGTRRVGRYGWKADVATLDPRSDGRRRVRQRDGHARQAPA